MPMKQRDANERFDAMVEHTPGGCWEWRGALNRAGYGKFKARSYVQVPAHRFAWERANGRAIRPGYFICHHCDNPKCVRPDHLYEGTPQENTQDWVWKHRAGIWPLPQKRRVTHCKRGHEFTPETTMAGSDGRRQCRICRREHQRMRAIRRREERAISRAS